jgi:hypothetical protein
MANCSGHVFTFADLGASSFHLEPTRFALGQSLPSMFGANSYPVLIDEHYVACEPSGIQLLNSWAATTGAVLGCTPLKVTRVACRREWQRFGLEGDVGARQPERALVTPLQRFLTPVGLGPVPRQPEAVQPTVLTQALCHRTVENDFLILF